MAKFSVGDRVRVPNRHPEVEILLWGRIGTVTSVGPPIRRAGEDDPSRFDEQQYVVRFPGLQGGRAVWELWENWLEPAPSDERE